MSLRAKLKGLKDRAEGRIRNEARGITQQSTPHSITLAQSVTRSPEIGHHPPSLESNPRDGNPQEMDVGPGPIAMAPVELVTSSIAMPPAAQDATAPRWVSLERLAGVLNPVMNAFGPLKDIIIELVDFVKIYEEVAGDQREYSALRSDLETLFEALKRQFDGAESPTMTTTIANLCRSIEQELNEIKILHDSSKMKQYLRSGSARDDVLARYRRVYMCLIRISLNTSLSTQKAVELQAQTTIIQDMIAEQQNKNAHSTHVLSFLSRLSPSFSANYNSSQAIELKRGSCTLGTRIDVLAHLRSWVSTATSTVDSGAIYWLNGMAGTGKTTIAYSFCEELEAEHQLAASFFCSRLLPECRDVNRIIPSVAYQLAQYSLPFQSALLKVLEKDPDIHTKLASIQFESLISKPLLEIEASLPTKMAVVIDALDECENKESTRLILRVLLDKAPTLPIKFFVSSRPEPEIRDEMMDLIRGQGRLQLFLHELDADTVQADIGKYLRTSLAPMAPSSSEIADLVKQAGILFIYAATVVRYISYGNFRRNPHSRLRSVLNTGGSGGSNRHKDIDELYTTVLSAAIDDDKLEDTEREDMIQVLRTVVCAREPLTTKELSGLLQLGEVDRVRAAIEPLWSVLHVVGTNELVTTLHASFPDYLLDPMRSKLYHCNPQVQNNALSRFCFDLISQTRPPFNICGLESSFVPDENIGDLAERIQQVIPEHLMYACRYWAAHVVSSGWSVELGQRVQDFLSARFLLWLEIMNLKKCAHLAEHTMQEIVIWSTTGTKELSELAHDSWRFTTTFASSAVSRCTPHLYLSMLPFWPDSRPISRVYKGTFRGLTRIGGTAIDRRQLTLLVTQSFGEPVNNATFLKDGRCVAFVLGNSEGPLVVGPYSGRTLLGPLEGHGSSVGSAEYSPDGTRIATGSADDTIRFYDAENGQMILGPLKGHTGGIRSVRFSPDGTRIATGSEDKTIRFWDVHTGDMVLGPLEEHIRGVYSLAYSPNGAHVVSGSEDKTLRVWDTQTGESILGPLEGHSDPILSVGYSPHGTHIISGASDHTIRVWSATGGDLVLGPLRGHTGIIFTVAYSPNGKHIVSGSMDRTILVWDALTGDIVLGPLEGHSNWVLTVAFSPDGTRIISGSMDQTLRMWDASIQEAAPTSPESYPSDTTAAGYSPDGTRIVSGSGGGLVCVRDAEQGGPVLGPLEGHTGRIISVCYSPNGRYIASSCERQIQIWDVESGATLLGPLTSYTSLGGSATFSPDGTCIISSSSDGIICAWDVQNGRVKMILEPPSSPFEKILSARYLPGGTHIAVATSRRIIQIWGTRSGDMKHGPLREYPANASTMTQHSGSLAFDCSPNGADIAISYPKGHVSIWDAWNDNKLQTPGSFQGHTHWVTSISYSLDGAYIVTGSSDKTIRVWEAKNGNTVFGALEGHTEGVESVKFSPDGTQVLSTSLDLSTRVWDVRTKVPPIIVSFGASLTLRFLLQVDRNFASSPSHVEWVLNHDGWVVDPQSRSRLLLWVPNDLRGSLLRPRNTFLISERGYTGLNFDGALMGESWADCHIPR